jgi:hypothetical protein
MLSHPGEGRKPIRPTPELAARIQNWISELKAESLGAWPVRVCRDELNALPVLSNLIYIWALRPDGTVLCLDHESFSHHTEPETDPLILYAAFVCGAKEYPELQELVPPPPAGTRLCGSCGGTGLQTQEGIAMISCYGCRGLGWIISPLPR